VAIVAAYYGSRFMIARRRAAREIKNQEPPGKTPSST